MPLHEKLVGVEIAFPGTDNQYYSCRFTVSARPYVFRDGHAAACGYVSGCWGWRLD